MALGTSTRGVPAGKCCLSLSHLLGVLSEGLTVWVRRRLGWGTLSLSSRRFCLLWGRDISRVNPGCSSSTSRPRQGFPRLLLGKEEGGNVSAGPGQNLLTAACHGWAPTRLLQRWDGLKGLSGSGKHLLLPKFARFGSQSAGERHVLKWGTHLPEVFLAGFLISVLGSLRCLQKCRQAGSGFVGFT